MRSTRGLMCMKYWSGFHLETFAGLPAVGHYAAGQSDAGNDAVQDCRIVEQVEYVVPAFPKYAPDAPDRLRRELLPRYKVMYGNAGRREPVPPVACPAGHNLDVDAATFEPDDHLGLGPDVMDARLVIVGDEQNLEVHEAEISI